MNGIKFLFATISVIYISVVIITMIKSKKFVINFLSSALQGICCLFAVNLLGQYIAVDLPVNGWTIGFSSIGGISGVIMMLLCDVFI